MRLIYRFPYCILTKKIRLLNWIIFFLLELTRNFTIMDVQNHESLSDTIDFIRSIEFSDEITPKKEKKEEGACKTDAMKSEPIIRPKLEPRETLNSGQLEIKSELTFQVEVKKEIVKEYDFMRDFNNKGFNSRKFKVLANESLGKTIEIESREDDDPMLEFFKNIEFSEEVKPKIEIKEELMEPKKEVDNDMQIGLGVLDTMDDFGFEYPR